MSYYILPESVGHPCAGERNGGNNSKIQRSNVELFGHNCEGDLETSLVFGRGPFIGLTTGRNTVGCKHYACSITYSFGARGLYTSKARGQYGIDTRHHIITGIATMQYVGGKSGSERGDARLAHMGKHGVGDTADAPMSHFDDPDGTLNVIWRATQCNEDMLNLDGGTCVAHDCGECDTNYSIGQDCANLQKAGGQSGIGGPHHADSKDEEQVGDVEAPIIGDSMRTGALGNVKRTPQDQSDAEIVDEHVQVFMADGRGLLQLRGGGPQGRRSVNSSGRLLGAGVRGWLEDSDYESAELAELQRRQCEMDIVDPVPPRRDMTVNTMEDARAITIMGEWNGRRTYVCTACGVDTYIAWGRDSWQHSPSWQCQRCGPRTTITADGSPDRTVISIAEALDRQGRVTISIADALAEESTRGSDALDVQDVWGIGEVHYEDEAQQQAQNDVQWGPGTCQTCGITMGQGAHEWRICVCTAWYCEGCAHGPCAHCPAQYIAEAARRGSGAAEVAPIAEPPQITCSSATSVPVTPDEALVRRRALAQRRRQDLDSRRAEGRKLVKRQVRQGTRPRRERNFNGQVMIATANCTSDGSLRSELQHGCELQKCDHLLIQEHRLQDEAIDVARRWAAKLGWDAHIEAAYTKRKKPGGGTAVLASDRTGVRPGAEPPECLRGRCAFGNIDIGGAVLAVSWYGVTGGRIQQQLKPLRALAERIIALGLPTIIGGDWQVTTAELEGTGFPKLIGASICAGRGATNTASGRRIDYFVVSNSLLAEGWAVEHLHGTTLATHRPAVLKLGRRRCREECSRFLQPKLLPVHPAVGPRRQRHDVIDWSQWEAVKAVAASDDFDDDLMTNAAQSWYAGAEAELLDVFDIDVSDGDGQDFIGMGEKPVIIRGRMGGKYRHSPDEAGLVGHRLAWVTRGIHMLTLHLGKEGEGGISDDSIDILRRIGHRAAAFLRTWSTESRRTRNGTAPGDTEAVEDEARLAVRRGLKALAALVRPVHRNRPVIEQIIRGSVENLQKQYREMMVQIAEVLSSFTAARRRAETKKLRSWARAAPAKVAHRATKNPTTGMCKTASARKDDRGERTEQRAADAGRAEYRNTWKATDSDRMSEDVLKAMEAMAVVERASGEEEELQLPPWSGDKVFRASAKFRGDAGPGFDCLRPRHVIHMSRGARDALGELYTQIEKVARWPLVLRTVIEVALAKKSGGARLVGLTTALYRIWAKARYLDCRSTMEMRIKRPYLTAAPSRGAARAVFDQTWGAEAAYAHGEEMASSIIDFKQYYEYIRADEVMQGGRKIGLPNVVMLLSAHLYLGPRHIRCGQAVAEALFPTRSILAGCAWATMIIRIIMVGPTDRFLQLAVERFKGWHACMSLMIYVDDGVVTTRGGKSAVEYLHVWVSRMLLRWIKFSLQKEVAENKLFCVTSSRDVCRTLKGQLAGEGFQVSTAGEVLGTDYRAGGQLRSRGAQEKRRMKMNSRGPKLRWWRGLGGRATDIARSGAWPSGLYGSDAIGIPPALLRDARRIHAGAARVRCSGASVTARLAVGGERGQEADPAVLHCNPPLKRIMEKMWDEPAARSQLVKMWLWARNDISQAAANQKWRVIRGPVGAAMLHLERTGGEWHKPFMIRVLGHEVNILATPPLQVMGLLKEQARLDLDRRLIEQLCDDRGWEKAQVLGRYSKGIDWDLLRGMLYENDQTAAERAALRLVACGGYWAEERKWKAGLRGTGTCDNCLDAVGSDWHSLHECVALEWPMLDLKLNGRIRALPQAAQEAALQPLVNMALPPRSTVWRPIEPEVTEGALVQGGADHNFGDGSGYHQDNRDCRVATWSVVRILDTGNGTAITVEALRGSIGGWYPTVPRGEIRAAIEHLRHAGPGAEYWGDCKHVVDILNAGVPRFWTSSASPNADLWTEARRLLNDHGAPMRAVKVKAHRSLSAARGDGEEGMYAWHGNDAADKCARGLARRLVDQDGSAARDAQFKETYETILRRIAAAAAWVLARRPNAQRKRVGLRDPAPRPEGQGGHRFRQRAGGGWECATCHVYCNKKNGDTVIARKACEGDIRNMVHPSHSLRVDSGTLWCRKCGCFATRWPRRLKLPCAEKPASAAQANVKRRLAEQKAPTTAAYLAQEAGFEDGLAGPSGRSSSDSTVRARSAPSGRYLRLPGGPLHHPRHHHHLVAHHALAVPVLRAAPADDDDGDGRADGRADDSVAPTQVNDRDGGGSLGSGSLVDDGSASSGRLVPAPPAPPEPLPAPRRRLNTKTRIGEQVFIGTVNGRAEQDGPAECAALAGASSWTARIAIGGSCSLTPCHRCGGFTRTRCKGCTNALCIMCAKAKSQCGAVPRAPVLAE